MSDDSRGVRPKISQVVNYGPKKKKKKANDSWENLVTSHKSKRQKYLMSNLSIFYKLKVKEKTGGRDSIRIMRV